MEKPAFCLVYALPKTKTVQNIRIGVIYSASAVPDQRSAAALSRTGIRLQFLTKRLPRLMTYAGTRCIIHAHEDGESVAIMIGRTTLPITKGEEFTNAAAEGHMTASGSSFSYRFKVPFRDTESVSSYRRKP